ncbi:paeninodin family lasso peptide [Candidatus Pristimantibacillus sp. PTI5]
MKKKEWNKPVLDVLSVHMTAASTNDGPLTDEAYVAGQPAAYPGQPRFTS